MRILFSLLILFTSTFFAQENRDLEFYLDKAQVMDITSDGYNLWFATNGNGIFQYFPSSGKWNQFSTQNGNISLDLFYCIAANSNFVWAGSTDGLFILDRKTGNWTKRKFSLGGQLSNWIRSIAYDEEKNVVWIGRFKYLTKYDLSTKKYTDYDLTIRNNEKTNTIKSIRVEKNYVWFGTEAGVHRYDKSKNLDDKDSRKFYDIKNNSFNGEGEQVSINTILTEREYIWFGLDEFVTPERPDFNVGGLYRFDYKTEWLGLDASRGLPGNGVYDLERTGNYIWASLYQFGSSTKETFGRGLALINRVNNQIIPIRDDRIPRSIYSIYFDGVNLWLGTENGLIKVNFFNKLAQWSGLTANVKTEVKK
ncbi:MAG: hypothetical protein HYZ10_15275 [Ignavibacteriales bacterium]|nr:hypothetical protein [Ignavibacteriales bacterium]